MGEQVNNIYNLKQSLHLFREQNNMSKESEQFEELTEKRSFKISQNKLIPKFVFETKFKMLILWLFLVEWDVLIAMQPNKVANSENWRRNQSLNMTDVGLTFFR